MNQDTSSHKPAGFDGPVSSFTGPIAELIGQGMFSPPSRPGLLATLDHFEILRVLGAGGMGIVLLARDSTSARQVAIKMIKPELVADSRILHRFVKEAGHMQRLRHKNVMPVLEVSDRSRGPYFVMPFFEQGSLARKIQPGQPLEREVIMDIASQVCDGLLFAHRRGIIHRDLKPANILLAADGGACLADFGLARTVFNDSVVDVEHQVCEGTPAYMSPGVAAGHAEDTRCDIYSFGALLYEMLTGEPPYRGEGAGEIRRQILAGPPKLIIDLNPKADSGLVTVAEAAMARELRDRYADMGDVQSDLLRIRESNPPAGTRERSARGFPKVLGIPSILWILIVLAGIGVLASLPWQFGHQNVGNHQTLEVAAAKRPSGRNDLAVHPALTLATLAGQAGVAGSADGAGTNAQFRAPVGVAVDGSGTIYMADTGNDTIRKVSPTGVVSTLAGLAGSQGNLDNTGVKARFWAPCGLAVDSAGNVYVAEATNHTVRKVSPNGEVGTIAGLGALPGSNDGQGIHARFRSPWGVALDPAGNIYVSDTGNSTIRLIATNGLVTTLAGLAGSRGAGDGSGDNARFNDPHGLAVDAAGNVYVADTGNHTLRKITPGGVVTTLAGLAGNPGNSDGNGDHARFWNPQGVAVDKLGNIYVADTGNSTIRKVTPAAVVTTLAGNAGSERGANFTGIALDSDGKVYVVETISNLIRKGALF